MTISELNSVVDHVKVFALWPVVREQRGGEAAATACAATHSASHTLNSKLLLGVLRHSLLAELLPQLFVVSQLRR